MDAQTSGVGGDDGVPNKTVVQIYNGWLAGETFGELYLIDVLEGLFDGQILHVLGA